MQAYLWTRGNTLSLKDEHLTIDCRIKCHLHTCTKMEHLMLLSLQLHLEPRVWGLNALWRLPSALFHLLYVGSSLHSVSTTEITFLSPPFRRVIITTAQTSLILFDLPPDLCCCCLCFSARHEVITKEILELDTWENQWNVVATNVLMHDSYDVCLVARLNPRDLIPPPPDLVDQ